MRSRKDVEEEFQVCHLDVVLFEYLFQRFGELEVGVGQGYRDKAVTRLSDGGLS